MDPKLEIPAYFTITMYNRMQKNRSTGQKDPTSVLYRKFAFASKCKLFILNVNTASKEITYVLKAYHLMITYCITVA